MEKKLLILGILLSHDMHGYQLNEMLQEYIGIPITLTKSNAYKLLSDMEKVKWITHKEEQKGNRPPRRVYSVTKVGKKAFYQLLRENLSTYPTPELPSVIGLDLLNTLPAEEAVVLLEKRQQVVKAKFKQLDETTKDVRQQHLGIGYLHRYYASELEWLIEIITRLKKT